MKIAATKSTHQSSEAGHPAGDEDRVLLEEALSVRQRQDATHGDAPP